MKSFSIDHTLGTIEVSAEYMGDHLVVCISGGDEPHIGSVVLAEPHPSLSGTGTSATSSVLNRIGHKDELVAREVAERLAKQLRTIVCCICGIHKDDATPEDILASTNLGEEIANAVLTQLDPSSTLTLG